MHFSHKIRESWIVTDDKRVITCQLDGERVSIKGQERLGVKCQSCYISYFGEKKIKGNFFAIADFQKKKKNLKPKTFRFRI